MSYSGIIVTPDNGVLRVDTSQYELTACVITDETVVMNSPDSIMVGECLFTRCRLQFTNNVGDFDEVGYGGNYTLSYGSENSTLNRVIVRDSVLAFSERLGGILVPFAVNELTRSKVHTINQISMYSGPGSVLDDVEFLNLRHEINFQPVVFSNVRYLAGSKIVTYRGGRKDLLGVAIEFSDQDGWRPIQFGPDEGIQNQLWFWDSADGAVDFDGAVFDWGNSSGLRASLFVGKTASFKFIDRDTESPQENVLFFYKDDRFDVGENPTEIARFITNSDGLLVGNYDTKLGESGDSEVRPTLYVLTTQYIEGGDREDVTAILEMRSYLHQTNIQFDGQTAFDRKTSGSLASDYSVSTYRDFRLVLDAGVTLSSSAAAAITGVVITDHDDSPVAWQGKEWGITVTCDMTLNPGLTANNVWHYIKIGLCSYDEFHGRDGIEWHIGLVDKTAGVITTKRGNYAGVQKGVRVINQDRKSVV